MKLMNIVKQIIELPKIKICFFNPDNDPEIDKVYHYFNQRHPKYKIFKNKTIGVMLYKLPDTVEEYENAIKGKNGVGYFNRRCSKLGYYTEYFDRNEYLDDIYQINTSTEERQGRKMSDSYLQKPSKENIPSCYRFFGIKNMEGKLVGYVKLFCTSQLLNISMIIGHKDYQNDNIMYKLLHDLIVNLIEEKEKDKIQYIMYDTFFGAKEGLKLYKKRNQFIPYRVKWIYKREN